MHGMIIKSNEIQYIYLYCLQSTSVVLLKDSLLTYCHIPEGSESLKGFESARYIR